MTNSLVPQRGTYFYTKRTIGLILLLAMAAVFFYSGYSKLHSENAFDAFQWTFLDLGVSSITLANIIAHLFIGFEFLLGLFLLCHIFLKSFTYPITILLLVVFIIYLGVVLLQQGNTGSCGCFGDKIAMKPAAAIWKNIAMIVITAILIKIYPIKPYKNQEWIAVVVGMLALIVPFIVVPLNGNNEPETVSQHINLEPLYAGAPAPDVNLRQGKHIVAFLSLTCPHCRKAAYLLQIIHQQHPDIPIYMVLNGQPINDSSFFAQTHATQVPHLLYRNTEGFMQMAGPYVPSIYWIDNSTIERKSNYYQLDPGNMEAWLKQ